MSRSSSPRSVKSWLAMVLFPCWRRVWSGTFPISSYSSTWCFRMAATASFSSWRRASPMRWKSLLAYPFARSMDSLMYFSFEMLAVTLMMAIFGLLIVTNVCWKDFRVTTRHPPITLTYTFMQIAQLIGRLLILVKKRWHRHCVFHSTMYENKSALWKSIENTAFILSVLSLSSNNCVNFYTYTLASAVFRKELIKSLRCG